MMIQKIKRIIDKTNCSSCFYPLQLHNLKNSEWVGDSEEFNFDCYFCKKGTIVKSKLFINYHINDIYLENIQEKVNDLSKIAIKKITQHLKKCVLCNDKINQYFLKNIEEKIIFKEKILKYFNENSIKIGNSEFKIEYFKKLNEIHITELEYKNKYYLIKQQDEFYRINDEIFYYLREKEFIVGSCSFGFKNENIVLNKIRFISEELLKSRDSLFNSLKDNKLNVKLSALKAIYKQFN